MKNYITIKRGVSRVVLLLGPLAIKFPRCRLGESFSDGLLLTGLLGNVLERDRWQRSGKHPALGQVYWGAPFGLSGHAPVLAAA